MRWSKRRKKFNKTFNVKKYHRSLILATARKLANLQYSSIAEYCILCGYPPFNKEIVKGMLNQIYGTALRGKHDVV